MVLRPRGVSPGFAGLAVLLALLTAWGMSRDAVRGPLRERAFDLLLPLLPKPADTGPDVIIVDIDRDTLARFGAWPWPRGRLADVVAAVVAGRPAALGLDMLLAGPDRFSVDGDATLARVLAGAPTVLGFVLETANSGQNLPATPILLRAPASLPGIWHADGIVGPMPELAEAAQGFGALVAAADPDGPIRRVPLLVLAGGVARPGLAVELVRLAQGASALLIEPGGMLHVGDIVVPLGSDATLRLTGSPTVHTISAATLIDQPNARGMLANHIRAHRQQCP